jgi:redox-sensitive bicupin YhaK (pirin superfamily)
VATLAEGQNEFAWVLAANSKALFRIHQDADIYASLLDKDESATHALGVGRRGWIQVVRGAIELNGKSLLAGDGAAVSDVPALHIAARADGSEILAFDLP